MYPKIYINRNNMFLQEEVMFCKKCGTQINDGARFCVSCGTAVEMPAAPEAPAYQPAPAAPAYQPAPAAPAYQAPAAPQQYYAPAPAAPKKKIEFITTLLVVIVLAALWTVFTVVGLSGENGYLEGHGIEMQIIYFCIYAGVAAVAVMTVRTKGLDLSLRRYRRCKRYNHRNRHAFRRSHRSYYGSCTYRCNKRRACNLP